MYKNVLIEIKHHLDEVDRLVKILDNENADLRSRLFEQIEKSKNRGGCNNVD